MTRAARTVASPHVVCIDDFRPLARRRLPRPVFDYLDGGADGEVTLRENCRIFEDVKAASSGPVCFQLYLMGGRAASEAVIERARVAGCSALVVTIDTPVAGLRERDYRNGMKELMSGGLLEKIPFLSQVLARPAWIGRASCRERV